MYVHMDILHIIIILYPPYRVFTVAILYPASLQYMVKINVVVQGKNIHNNKSVLT